LSKIIEALKTQTSRQAVKDAIAEAAPKEMRVEKSAHELTQEQLADIYFSATGKPKTAEPPVIIKLIERPRLATYIPWIIACLAFTATLFSLFSTKRVLVDIKVLDERTALVHGLDRRSLDNEASLHATGTGVSEAEAHRFSVPDFTFEGAAYLNSSKDKNGTLTLINSSVAPFARASLLLDPPLDLAGSKLVFYAKGGRGGENVAIALKDEENVQGFYKGKYLPFPDKLTTGWQKAEIFIGQDTAKDFDARRVTSLRFDFGSKDTGNKPGDLILIKDLQWVPES
jgi:hypothetical protein